VKSPWATRSLVNVMNSETLSRIVAHQRCLKIRLWTSHYLLCLYKLFLVSVTIRNAILTCAQKLTRVSLIYRTERRTKKGKQKKLKSVAYLPTCAWQITTIVIFIMVIIIVTLICYRSLANRSETSQITPLRRMPPLTKCAIFAVSCSKTLLATKYSYS